MSIPKSKVKKEIEEEQKKKFEEELPEWDTFKEESIEKSKKVPTKFNPRRNTLYECVLVSQPEKVTYIDKETLKEESFWSAIVKVGGVDRSYPINRSFFYSMSVIRSFKGEKNYHFLTGKEFELVKPDDGKDQVTWKV